MIAEAGCWDVRTRTLNSSRSEPCRHLEMYLRPDEALRADEALSLSRADSKWCVELAQPTIWLLGCKRRSPQTHCFGLSSCRQRYLNGPPDLLARPVLSDGNAGALFTGPSVHPENYRAIVAALRQPGWFRHYKGQQLGCSVGRAGLISHFQMFLQTSRRFSIQE